MYIAFRAKLPTLYFAGELERETGKLIDSIVDVLIAEYCIVYVIITSNTSFEACTIAFLHFFFQAKRI